MTTAATERALCAVVPYVQCGVALKTNLPFLIIALLGFCRDEESY